VTGTARRTPGTRVIGVRGRANPGYDPGLVGGAGPTARQLRGGAGLHEPPRHVQTFRCVGIAVDARTGPARRQRARGA
jgi:hypothetical protein